MENPITARLSSLLTSGGVGKRIARTFKGERFVNSPRDEDYETVITFGHLDNVPPGQKITELVANLFRDLGCSVEDLSLNWDFCILLHVSVPTDLHFHVFMLITRNYPFNTGDDTIQVLARKVPVA